MSGASPAWAAMAFWFFAILVFVFLVCRIFIVIFRAMSELQKCSDREFYELFSVNFDWKEQNSIDDKKISDLSEGDVEALRAMRAQVKFECFLAFCIVLVAWVLSVLVLD